MKIGIFDPYLDDVGGGERYLVTLASCLSKRHHVDIFWDNKKDLLDIKNRFLINVTKINLKPNIFSNKFSKIEKLKISKRYDLVIILSDGSIPLLFSKKIFLHMQQPISHKLSLKEKIKLKRVDKIICNSTFTKNFIEKNYSYKCDLLYPPLSVVGKKEKKENIILHVGRFRVINVKSEDYKKQQFMIDTFKDMVDKGLRDWKLLMAISLNDEEDKSFIEMIRSAKNYPIEFLINYPKDKLWRVASLAKIYWHATGYGEDLDKNPQLAEHFGISTVEAMSAGVVPVVISAGGQKEIVEDGKNGLLWKTKEEFVKNTLKLVKDEGLLVKLSEEAYKRSIYFNEENFCKGVYKLIDG